MYHKTVLLFLLFFILSLRSFSAVFVVTSNADSGPGTLREALTKAAANGSATKDYIKFNLSDLSESGRTILLTTQLPDVSSNLVIDGSTQPGVNFGVSDAKIAIFYNTPVEQELTGLAVVGQHDVEIYGLYLKNITDTRNQMAFWERMGIHLENDKNITIGAAGKGNVINGFLYPLVVNPPHGGQFMEFFENLSVKDNFFGIDADGETLSLNETAAVSLTAVIGKIDIGGTAAEGNLFAQGLSIYQINMYDSTDPQDYYVSSPADIQIKNNKIGVDYSVQESISTSSGLSIETIDPGGKNTYHIEDNVIVSPKYYAIYEGNNGRPITILRNYIGTDKTLAKSFKTGGIFLYGATNIAIGSSNPADANYITNCNPISIWPYTNATVNKNSIFCTVNAQPMHYVGWNEFLFPEIKILQISSNSISGTATPNSSIELFYSDVCKTCSPQTFFASVKADGNGKWIYNGPIKGTVIASATFGDNTSDFTQTTINIDNIKIIHACSDNGLGSITGAIPSSASNIKWVDEHGKIVGHNADLLNVKLGKYKLVVHNGDCGDSTSYFEIKNKFIIDTSTIVRKQPSCGNSMGGISGINFLTNVDDVPVLTWKDAGDKVVANTLNLDNVPAGSYYLTIKTPDGTCSESYGPFNLKNATGPNVNQTFAKIQSTNCGQSTGSITNISATGTGTLKYSWTNDQQQEVGTDKDLLNQPGGTYKLQVTDNTQCGPIYTTEIVIPETNGITLDESKVQTSIASCSQNNGTIKGISFTGATKFQWTDANNKVVSNTADFTGAAPGVYTFTASNNFGCSKTSQPYTVGQQAPVQLPQYSATLVASCFGGKNGSVYIATDGLVKSLRWVDSQGAPAGDQSSLTGVAAGTYTLYITDQNGCENYYNTYTVDELPEYKVASTGETVSDQCELKIGSISNVIITGGVPPYTYKWTNANNQVIGETSSITNLAAGNYVLNVVDTRCGNVDIHYTITDESADVAAPSVSDLQLCSSGSALLFVNNASSSVTYRLYDNQSNAHPIDEQNGGRFNITVNSNRSYFISQLNGTCESPRAEVKVIVGLSVVNIANTFTPNGDGINDYWKITSIENYPDAIVQVFSRYGQKVYESKGYSTPFEGNLNGKKLPAGVYYYIINLKTNCNILSGSLTIIR
jgi:gliding motility-associated-like protein